jgi:DNA-binding CsgD family transcriptional regulator
MSPIVTPAEREALEAMGRYGTVDVAAAHLGKSRHTVREQLERARERLGVSTTIEAVWRVYVDKRDIEPEYR